MAQEGFKRKLTAILCADVKGYSRLMDEDEVGTFHILSSYLEIMNTIIEAHRGYVFSSPRDAFLAQFAREVRKLREPGVLHHMYTYGIFPITNFFSILCLTQESKVLQNIRNITS